MTINRTVIFEVNETKAEFGVAFQGAAVGETNTGANVGTGDAGVFRDKTGATLNFKKLVGAGTVTITETADEITVDGSGSPGGFVTGPGSSLNNAIALWNGATGTVLKNSSVLVDAGGNMSSPGTYNGRNVAVDGATLDTHVADMANPHGTTAALVGAIPASEKGAPSGVATLDGGGELSAAQIPASVALQADLTAHVGDTGNPHSVSPVQVGRDTAQWNANRLTGRTINPVAPTPGEFLAWSGTQWEPTGGVGTGDVTGPAGATDNAIARYDGTTGKLIQDSNVTIDDAGNIATAGTVDGRDVSVDGGVLDGHVASTSNPHSVTAAQAGADPAGTAAAAVTTHETTYDHANLPTSGQKAALVGTSGTPGAGNAYVTDSDPRIAPVTRNKFFQADCNGNFGTYRVRSLGSVGAFRFNFHVPADFDTLVGISLIGQANAAVVAGDIDLTSEYGAVGESASNHTETDTTSTYNFNINELTKLDLSSVFSSLAAGDYAGVFVDHNGVGTTINYLGILLEYTT